MLRPFDAIEWVAHRVIGGAIEVHRTLGPGLLEAVYRECLTVELRDRGMLVECECAVPIVYKGRRVKCPLKIDLLVERSVVVEVKAVNRLHPVYDAQLITHLTLAGFQAGLLLNFNEVLLKNGLRRLDHPNRYAKTHN